MAEPRKRPEDELDRTGVDWERWARLVRRVIGAPGLSQDSVDDLTQETLLAFARKQGSIREPERWVRVVAQRLVLKHFRGRYRHRYRDTVSFAESAERPPAASTEAALDLRTALLRVPDELRVVLLLSERDGLSAEQIATQLEMTRGEVYNLKRRAVARLRRELDS